VGGKGFGKEGEGKERVRGEGVEGIRGEEIIINVLKVKSSNT
jgi:hypothetical protein